MPATVTNVKAVAAKSSFLIVSPSWFSAIPAVILGSGVPGSWCKKPEETTSLPQCLEEAVGADAQQSRRESFTGGYRPRSRQVRPMGLSQGRAEGEYLNSL